MALAHDLSYQFDGELLWQHGHRISQPAGLADQVRGGVQSRVQRDLLHRDDAQVVRLRLLQIHQRRLQRLRWTNCYPKVSRSSFTSFDK